jgi:hypothetical protein
VVAFHLPQECVPYLVAYLQHWYGQLASLYSLCVWAEAAQVLPYVVVDEHLTVGGRLHSGEKVGPETVTAYMST